MPNIFTNPASAALLFSDFSRLDQQIRRNVFGFLKDDLRTAVEVAVDQRQYAHEVGSAIFSSYQATDSHQLFVFLAALTLVQEFSSHVRTIILSSPFDDPGQSSFYEWLYEFGQMALPTGHLGLPVQYIGRSLVRACDNAGLSLVNGKLQGTANWPPRWQHDKLLGRILPALCPNVVRVELPTVWGFAAAQTAWASFPNAAVVRRP